LRNIIIGIHDDSDHEVKHDGGHEKHDDEKVDPDELHVEVVGWLLLELFCGRAPFSPAWEIDVEEVASPLREHKSTESAQASKLLMVAQRINVQRNVASGKAKHKANIHICECHTLPHAFSKHQRKTPEAIHNLSQTN
tara:strand:- start:890 stop:1303 length:414 start_codon:yes stop_codon:yes gene_type:complete